jgi:hypothetical protein
VVAREELSESCLHPADEESRVAFTFEVRIRDRWAISAASGVLPAIIGAMPAAPALWRPVPAPRWPLSASCPQALLGYRLGAVSSKIFQHNAHEYSNFLGPLTYAIHQLVQAASCLQVFVALRSLPLRHPCPAMPESFGSLRH